MENVVLIVHLILALGIIAVVLLQRSEGRDPGPRRGGRGRVNLLHHHPIAAAALLVVAGTVTA